jgi:hypothetical protein
MRRTALWLSALAMAGVAAGGTIGFAKEPVERLTAFAVDMSNMAGRTRTGTVDIVIDRWSTDQERDQLLGALREGGADGLLRALQKIKDPAGRVQTPGNVGYPLRFARQTRASDGSRRIIIATDRPISYFEAVNRPRTSDYPFMVIDLRLGPDGKGEGKLMPIARITANEEHVVEIENYASEPVRLTQVREVK